MLMLPNLLDVIDPSDDKQFSRICFSMLLTEDSNARYLGSIDRATGEVDGFLSLMVGTTHLTTRVLNSSQ